MTFITIISFSCESKNSQPNIILVLVDDQGWTDSSVRMMKDREDSRSDFYETPNIDSLANMGYRFTQAYSAHPVCSPTRAAIMTGKHPTRLNITDWIPGQDPRDKILLGPSDLHELTLEENTIAETLQKQGYKTFFAGKWHLGDTGL